MPESKNCSLLLRYRNAMRAYPAPLTKIEDIANNITNDIAEYWACFTDEEQIRICSTLTNAVKQQKEDEPTGE